MDFGSYKWAIVQNRSIKQTLITEKTVNAISDERCTNYSICRISLFPELSDIHFSRGMEILEMPEIMAILQICKPEKFANTWL